MPHVKLRDAINPTFTAAAAAAAVAALAPADRICRRRAGGGWLPAAFDSSDIFDVCPGVVGQLTNRPTLDSYLAANRA